MLFQVVGSVLMFVFAVLHVGWLVYYLAPATVVWAAELASRRRRAVSAEIRVLSSSLVRVTEERSRTPWQPITGDTDLSD